MKTEGIDGIERFKSPGKGRGLRATKHFKVGDLLFSCPAYAYVLTVSERGAHCEFCFTSYYADTLSEAAGIASLLCNSRELNSCRRKCFTSLLHRKEGLSKCGKCKKAFYCNVDCQKGDWSMHKLECSAMCAYGENWSPSETVRLTARIIAKQKTLTERTVSEKLLLVKELEAPYSDTNRAVMREVTQIPDGSANKGRPPVNCNGFTIEDEELSHLGSAVFPEQMIRCLLSECRGGNL
ncbi:hypothetical protein JZ751_004795 [Albula glossodonta]|uniref:[histone H3]-lysine(4) N-trimethyltransferase n=1 Tax=Albula glossodonta TaxID=121402 RepID=A0A8T2PCJ9_9TELE|nr:hypothetical protein JZ751_004795 [Albula glossodonta]